jgi:hypothetical protein
MAFFKHIRYNKCHSKQDDPGPARALKSKKSSEKVPGLVPGAPGFLDIGIEAILVADDLLNIVVLKLLQVLLDLLIAKDQLQ